jgi:fibro-slime domain-containing protein
VSLANTLIGRMFQPLGRGPFASTIWSTGMFTRLFTLGTVATLAAMPVLAQGPAVEFYELAGIIRDFHQTHPDFESYPGTYNKVLQMLGEDGRPQLDLDHWKKTKGTSKQSVTSKETFSQWFKDDPEVNVSIPYSIRLDPHPSKPGVYYFAREKPDYFFPIDNQGFGNSPKTLQGKSLKWAEGNVHNFHFTYELSCEFTYTNPDDRTNKWVFQFTGDDDVWVYINGHLAIDLGGVHSQKSASVDVDDNASKYGLEPGKDYVLRLFFAERHTSESNFRIETTMNLKKLPPTEATPLFD